MFSTLLAVLLLGMVPSEAPPALSVALKGVPVAAPAEPVAVTGHLSASGIVIMDMKSGQQLYARDPAVRRPVASLTKLMTALLIVENYPLDDVVTIPSIVFAVEGNRAYLPAGEQFRIGDLLSALLIASANDAAEVLARYHSGSSEAFVAAMNGRAQALGLTETSFANPAGLDDPGQWSTPRDVALLASFAMRHAAVAERLGKRGARIWSLQGTPVDLTHTHALLHADTTVRAGKTGTTKAAKECLLSVVQQNDRKYLVVLLRSDGRYRDMQKILYALIEPEVAVGAPDTVGNVVVVGGG